MNFISISTVTPVYRGAKTLEALVTELHNLKVECELNNLPFRIVESIFVDDGSLDNSILVLQKLQETYPWIQIIELSRNFGQHPATVAGILHTCGDWIVTLDEDLQHHPKYIPEMLKHAIVHNCDIVYAQPLHNVHESFIRDMSSKMVKKVLAKISGNPNMPLFNSYRLARGTIARAAAAVSIDQSYLDVSLSWFTKKVDSLRLDLKDLRYIESGTSGYSIKSLMSHARKMLQTSNVKIFRLGAIIGFIALFIGIVATIIVFIIKIMSPELIGAQGWTSVFISTLVFGGLNAFLIGLVLENVSVLLMQSHGKPKFFEVDRTTDKILKDWFTNN